MGDRHSSSSAKRRLDEHERSNKRLKTEAAARGVACACLPLLGTSLMTYGVLGTSASDDDDGNDDAERDDDDQDRDTGCFMSCRVACCTLQAELRVVVI
jgi:hypothetical protein